MVSIYNFGLGLSVEDDASASIDKVGAALLSLERGGGAARSQLVGIGRALEDTSQGVTSLDRLDQTTRRFTTSADALTGSLLGVRRASLDLEDVLTGHSLDTAFMDVLAAATRLSGALITQLGAGAAAASRSLTDLEDLSLETSRNISRETAKFAAFERAQKVVAELYTLGQPVSELEDATHKLAIEMGATAERAAGMRYEVYALSATTGFSVGELTELTKGLGRASIGLDEMSVSSQKTAVAMVNTFGVGAGDIARVEKETKLFGSSLTDVADIGADFSQRFGVTGVIQALPGVITDAISSLTKYGRGVTGSMESVIKGVTGMGATFAKTFGKTMAAAISDAKAHFDTFAGAASTHEDVFLGLADSFSPLQTAFMQLGIPVMEAGNLMRQSQGDAVEFAQRTNAVLSRLDPFRRSRFLKQLRKELPESTMRLIGPDGLPALAAALDVKREAKDFSDSIGGKSVASFEEMSGSMRETIKEGLRMWEAVKELTAAVTDEIVVQLGWKNAIIGAKDVVGDFADKIHEFVKSGEFKAWVDWAKPAVKTIGAAVMTLGAAFSGIAGTLAGLATAKAVLGGVGKAVRLVGGPIEALVPGVGRLASVFGGAKGALLGFGKRALKVAGPVGLVISSVEGVGVALKDMGKTLADPSATGTDKFRALLQGNIKGAASMIDSLLLGIPSTIANTFFPDLERSFDEGMAGIFGGVEEWFAGIGAAGGGSFVRGLFSKLGGWIGDFADSIVEELPSWTEIAKDWSKDIGRAVGGLVKMLFEGVVWGVKNLNTYTLAAELGAWLGEGWDKGTEELSLGDKLYDLYYKASLAIGEIVEEFAIGLFEPFIQEIELVPNYWSTALNELELAGKRTFNWFMGMWIDTGAWLLKSTDELMTGLNTKLLGLGSSIAKAVGDGASAAVGFIYDLGLKVETTGNNITYGLKTAFETGVHAVQVALDPLIATINKIVSGLISGFGNAFASILDKAIKLAEYPLVEAFLPKGALETLRAARGMVGAVGATMADAIQIPRAESAAALKERLAAIEAERSARENELAFEMEARKQGLQEDILATSNALSAKLDTEARAMEAQRLLRAKLVDDGVTKAKELVQFEVQTNLAKREELGKERSAIETMHQQETARAEDSNQFASEAQKVKDTALRQFGAYADERLNQALSRESTAQLKTKMEASMQALAESVRSGGMTVEAARVALIEQAEDAANEIVQAQKVKMPGGVTPEGAESRAVVKAPTAAGANAIVEAEKARKQRVEVWVRVSENNRHKIDQAAAAKSAGVN